MASGTVTEDGRKIMLDRTYNSSPTRLEVTQFKVGTGTTDAAVTDTDLENPIPLNGTDQIDDCDATTGWSDTADCTLSVNTTTFKQGTGSLNWTKDGTSSTVCASAKTTTSVDFTSKDLSIWFYVIDSTALAKLPASSCLNIRLGSDGSNYYEWNIDKSALTAGQWNLIDGLNTGNADSTTGTPVLASMDYTRIEIVSNLTSDTWSAGDFIVDDIKAISSDDYTKDFEVGYPTLDFTNIQAEIRTRVSTVQGNGYPISEHGVFNEDGTPLMESRDTFTAVSKSSNDELIFVVKTLVQ